MHYIMLEIASQFGVIAQAVLSFLLWLGVVVGTAAALVLNRLTNGLFDNSDLTPAHAHSDNDNDNDHTDQPQRTDRRA